MAEIGEEAWVSNCARSLRRLEALFCDDPERREEEMALISAELISEPGEGEESRATKRENLKTHIRTIARLAEESPVEDIRLFCVKLLDHAREIGIACPVSDVISWFDVYDLSFNPQDESVLHLLQEVFFENGGILPRFELVMSLFPQYLECHFSLLHSLMKSDGPLPLQWRYYIAIIAAARYNCTYLVRLLEVQFLLSGGEEEWLLGIDHIPVKLRRLCGLNELLAHQPWRLTRRHIGRLASGHDLNSENDSSDPYAGQDPWAVRELMLAILIASVYHSLAAFALACGVVPEVDIGGMELLRKEREIEVDVDVEQTIVIGNDALRAQLANASLEESSVEVDHKQEFVHADEGIEASASREMVLGYVAKYIGPYTMQHEEFNISSKEYVLIQQHEFCWKVQGMSMVEQVFPEVAQRLDAEFDLTFSMTQNMLYGRSADTGPMRSSIWYYVQRVKGVCYYDFDYRLVNRLVNREMKTAIRKIVCLPHTVVKQDYLNFGTELLPHEKVHINILTIESRRQACLLHALNAMAEYMKRA